MLDFRGHSASKAAQDRREHKRLLVLILFVGMTIVVVDRVRDPTFWRFIDLILSPPQEGLPTTAIDNRLDQADIGSMPDKFLAAAETDDKSSPKISSDDLSAIRDDTLSTRSEQPVTLRLLDILKRTPQSQLQRDSIGRITYAQLFRQPQQYRGRLVTTAGVVRRVNRIELFPNDLGIEQYYQVWLWPTDNPTSPMVVYCLQLPKGFPTGMDLAEEVEATGFFFKRWAYPAQDAVRTAPTILAKTLEWNRRPDMTPPALENTWTIPLAVCVAIVVALLTTMYVYLRTRPTHLPLPDQPLDFDAISKLDQHK